MLNRQLVIIGRQLIKKHPELANELLNEAETSHIQAATTDYSMLPEILKSFSKHMGIEPEEITGDIHRSRAKTQVRRMFIALCLKVYDPDFLSPNKSSKMRTGIRDSIAGVLDMNPNKVSNLAGYASFSYNVKRGEYKAFSEKVDEIYNNIFNK